MAGGVCLIRRSRQLRFENFILARRNLRPYLCRDLVPGALGVRGWLRLWREGLAPIATPGALGRPAMAGTVALGPGRARATAHQYFLPPFFFVPIVSLHKKARALWGSGRRKSMIKPPYK